MCEKRIPWIIWFNAYPSQNETLDQAEIKTKRKSFKSIISDDEILYIIGGLDEGDNYLDSIESFDLKITDFYY